MKKIIFVVAAVSLIFGLAACVSVDKSAKEEYQKATGTPKNSVVYYGFFFQNTYQSFSQMDPNFPPDFQEMKGQIFVSKPVAPGSTYALECIEGIDHGGTIEYYWSEYLPLHASLNPLIVHVSKKPGLQYIGYINAEDLAGGCYTRYEKFDDDGEKVCLKGALELYKGTAWESVIQNRLDELEGKK